MQLCSEMPVNAVSHLTKCHAGQVSYLTFRQLLKHLVLIDGMMTFEDLLGSLIVREQKGKSTQTAKKRFAML